MNTSKLHKDLSIFLALFFVFSLSIVYTQVNAAGIKPSQQRDSKRINDMANIQFALEAFFDANQFYPASIAQNWIGTYIGTVPVDPVTGRSYFYAYNNVNNAYHLWTELETKNNVLPYDSDADSTFVDSTTWYFGDKINAALGTTETCRAKYSNGTARDCIYDIANTRASDPQLRDEKRIRDVQELEKAVKAYFDMFRKYPTALDIASLGFYFGDVIPRDPYTDLPYFYAYNPLANPEYFHIWTQLERSNPALASDGDMDSSAWNGGNRIDANDSADEQCAAAYAGGAARDCIYDLWGWLPNMDAQRISDINALKNAVEKYYADNGGRYPTALNVSYLGVYFESPSLPVDPYTGASYFYAYNPAANPQQYHLWTVLQGRNSALTSDSDIDSVTWAAGDRADFNDASDEACVAVYAAGAARDCIYDVGDPF